MKLIITCAIAFISAVLAGLGVGSGGLVAVCLAVYVAMPQIDAQLLNLIFFAASSLAALAVNIFKKRLSLSIILPLALPGCVFAVGASFIAAKIESDALGKAFGILMITLGGISLLYTLNSTKKK